ncbi:MAG: UDP-glucose/GDP-mannose dehydrogenase family protein [Actinomycetota bacterium]|nr:UDP-glucose/GDP-mannose dehydrogenase family protein [Actinomycetota bacterium]
MRVAVFGLGYVGTVTAGCLATNGHSVCGVDPESAKVEMVSTGVSPVVEPGLGRLISHAVGAGALWATTDAAVAVDGADVSLVCVGTPTSPQGSTDLSYVMRAAKEIAQALVSRWDDARFHAIVIRSTVPPGTVEGMVAPAIETELGRPLGDGFGVAMCPEFLREGSGVADFFDPPFTVVGTSDPRIVETMKELFGFLARPLRAVPVATAEALKYACNAFHATKVSFANELARLYRQMGVDTRQVMDLFCEDDRLNISPKYLRPGFAFGGSCLPKDLRSLLYLARMNSVDLPLLVGTATSNELTIREIAQRVLAMENRRVTLLGLSFKTHTDDLRESPNVELAETLLGKGCDLRIYDPIVEPTLLFGTNLRYVQSKLPHLQRLLATSAEEALEGADVAIAASNTGGIPEALVAARPPVVIDLSGSLGPEVEVLPGYQGAGW